jgi:hypothetical protein
MTVLPTTGPLPGDVANTVRLSNPATNSPDERRVMWAIFVRTYRMRSRRSVYARMCSATARRSISGVKPDERCGRHAMATILVAESGAQLRGALELALRQAGYRVLEAADIIQL